MKKSVHSAPLEALLGGAAVGAMPGVGSASAGERGTPAPECLTDGQAHLAPVRRHSGAARADKARPAVVATALYPAISSAKPKLRVGVMLDDWRVPQWIAAVLASIEQSGVAMLTTVILNRAAPAEEVGVDAAPTARLWRRYLERERRRGARFAEPFQLIDVQARCAARQTIEAVPLRIGALHRFTDADVAAVKRADLDVIVQLGFATLIGAILAAARHGVWVYRHGDGKSYGGDPAGFWEMYDGAPLTGATLNLESEENGGAVLYRSYGATQNAESLAENRYWSYRKAIPFVARCLRQLYEQGPGGLATQARSRLVNKQRTGLPGNRHMLRLAARVQWRHAIVRLQDRLKIQRDYWSLAVAPGTAPGDPLRGKTVPLRAPRGHFWADPMLVRHDGRHFLFFEDYVFAQRRAHISVAEISPEGKLGEVRPALRAEHHLSYPFVFHWRGSAFMIPESASANAVQLYRAREFPTRWEYAQELLSGIKAVDTTLHEQDGYWYLFAGVSEAGGSTCDELFLFVAESPLGPWRPHPMNPIVSDVRCARPGGGLFQRAGRLYRPAQNCAGTYGRALAIMEITELTPARYAEKLAYAIEPDWQPDIYGCHTLALADDLLVLDCKSLKWRA